MFTGIDDEIFNATHRQLFAEGMAMLDSNACLPLLWGSAKLSSWYSIGLLMRGGESDIVMANKLLSNSLTQQDLDVDFEQNYGSFKKALNVPFSSGPGALWVGEIYDAYDPNDALFVTMAGMVAESLFADKLDTDLRKRLRQAMHQACTGNARREGDWHGDDMWPSYSNPWYLRCVCSAFVGDLMNDKSLVEQSDRWTAESNALWEQHDSPGEYNSPTYAGITLMALGLAQYCPKTSLIYQMAPKLIRSVWTSLSETYNPSLLNIAGPWDRTYGYCMTQYYASIAVPIVALTGFDLPSPMPRPLNGSSHYTDGALIPMQVLVSPYVEAPIITDRSVTSRFSRLYAPHLYRPKSIFPPHDKRPREYSYYLEEGLSVGGISFDEDHLGGPKGIPAQFVPGTIQWDSGRHGGGVGWLSVWPTSACATMVASPESLTITYPKPIDFASSPSSKQVRLHIGALPFLQLNTKSFDSNSESLPGLDLQLSGNIVERGQRSLRFGSETRTHGVYHYVLQYDWQGDIGVPELVISFKKQTPPTVPFRAISKNVMHRRGCYHTGESIDAINQ